MVYFQAGLSKDETSSIGSWSLPTEFDGITILTGNEAESIMMKNKQLLETNFQLEEQLRALEKNQIQMSEELANREEILKMRVWNTRPDAQSRKNQNPISGMIFNKINEYANSIEQNPHDQTPTQLKQLNKKVFYFCTRGNVRIAVKADRPNVGKRMYCDFWQL